VATLSATLAQEEDIEADNPAVARIASALDAPEVASEQVSERMEEALPHLVPPTGGAVATGAVIVARGGAGAGEAGRGAGAQRRRRNASVITVQMVQNASATHRRDQPCHGSRSHSRKVRRGGK
jgi:hypothetical protein